MSTGVIVFASCMDAERCPSQPVWEHIRQRQEKPDLLLLLGDQIYMDWGLSLRSVPRFKDGFDGLSEDRKAERLGLFAAEMHMRYKRQWAVPEFRTLVTDMASRNGPGSVMLTWDDHDFAWNNAYGVDTPATRAAGGTHDTTVPKAFKRIAWRLRRQFVDVLHHPGTYQGGAYPDRPLHDDDAPDPMLQRGALGRVPVLLLEERWYRSYRQQEGASMLGDEQRTELLEEIADGHGLLVVAGSSPLRHPYTFADQGWHTRDGSYDDLNQLLSTVAVNKRPVLYLAGDIHRNAYGGRIHVPVDGLHTKVSSIVQVLSSGAALGRVLAHKFLPSYGVVRIEGTERPSDCRIHISLEALGGYSQDVTLGVESIAAGGGVSVVRWKEPVTEGQVADMEGHRYVGEVVDSEPMTVLCGRERQRAERNVDSLPPLDIDRLDSVAFGDDSLGAAYVEPEVLSVQALHNGAFSVRRTRPGDAEFDAMLSERLTRTFKAAEANERNVVLFIHGFNKPFAESLDQAYALRALYASEVVLYSWPSGDAGDPDGLITALNLAAESTQAKVKAVQEAARLGFVLNQFAHLCQAYRGKVRPPVIVARSLGALALAHAFPGANTPAANALESKAVCRVVLSAPALLPNDPAFWHRRLTVSGCAEVVVTVNDDDRVLRFQNGGPLGAVWPPKLRKHGLHYVNFAGWDAVGDQHNYLLRHCGSTVDALNRRLVEGQSIDWAGLGGRHLTGPED